MKDIRLIQLTLDHFKGRDHLTLNFDGRSASIYGDNGTGKTTIYDAFTWLLFGKDSQGQTNFDIKPNGPDGQVRDHAAITAVEAVLEVSGQPMTLKRTYFEQWSTKRGSAVESFVGNTSEYYVDHVPVKKYEFERQVAELVNEETFRLLTSVTHFCQEMNWRERRKVLFDVCAVKSDAEIMASAPQFTSLASALGHLSLEDYQKKLTSERRGLSKTRDTVPARLDECQKTVQDLEGVDYAALHTERETRAERVEKLSAELLKLEHNALLDTRRNEYNSLRNQLTKLENDNESYRRTQAVQTIDERPAIQREITSQEQLLQRWKADKEAAERDAAHYESQIRDMRAKWLEVNAEQFSGVSCPTCGQALPGNQLEAAHAHYEKEKARRLDALVQEADRYKEKAANAQRHHERAVQECECIKQTIIQLNDKLSAIRPVEQPELTDMPEYAGQRAELLSGLAALESDIRALEGESTSIRAEIQNRIGALKEEISALDGELAKESMLSYARERMESLRAEARIAAEKLESLDRMLYLCDEFTRYKVGFIEESINARFRMVKFRLFAEQVNGGVADCCEPMVDGVPYSAGLNRGACMNAGIDIINVLSKHYGVRVPLFFDNAESVTRLLDAETQVVRLVVSAEDKELRCEYET